MSENVPKKRERRPGVASTRSGKCSGSAERAKLSSLLSTKNRKIATRPQDQDPKNPPNFLADLDLACTASAVVANRLAATARLLESHTRAGLPFGPEVVRVVRMAMMAAEATELLHSVAKSYAEWVEVGE